MHIILKNLILVILVAGVILVYLPYEIATLPFDIKRDLGFVRYAAGGLWLSGIGISLWCVRDFARLGNGTPAPVDPPQQLVVRGLYRYVRNPMYIGILLILAGHALWFQSFLLLLYGICFWVGFHLFVVVHEEPNLEKRFGDAYRAYRQSVPRWLPRIIK